MDAVIHEYVERCDSLPTIGRRHGVNPETIRRRLIQAGVRIRSQREGQLARYNRRGDVTGLAVDLAVSEERLLHLLRQHGFLADQMKK